MVGENAIVEAKEAKEQISKIEKENSKIRKNSDQKLKKCIDLLKQHNIEIPFSDQEDDQMSQSSDGSVELRKLE